MIHIIVRNIEQYRNGLPELAMDGFFLFQKSESYMD